MVVLAGAAWSDITCGKVYNWWLLGGVAAGIVLRGWQFLPPAGVMLAVGFCLFRFRMMGAGDGKLMAVMAGYLGLGSGMRTIAAGLLLGAVWSLRCMWRGRSFRARLMYGSAYFMRVFLEKKIVAYDALSRSGKDDNHRIPLAACLAVGGCLYLVAEAAVVVEAAVAAEAVTAGRLWMLGESALRGGIG